MRAGTCGKKQDPVILGRDVPSRRSRPKQERGSCSNGVTAQSLRGLSQGKPTGHSEAPLTPGEAMRKPPHPGYGCRKGVSLGGWCSHSPTRPNRARGSLASPACSPIFPHLLWSNPTRSQRAGTCKGSQWRSASRDTGQGGEGRQMDLEQMLDV